MLQLSYPRNRCQLIEWNKAPKKPLHGSLYQNDEIVENETIHYDFAIIRAKGSVTWKHVGELGSHSVLKLLRWDKKLDKLVEILKLGEFEGASGDYTTLPFDFQYSSTKLLWEPGQKGCAMHKRLLYMKDFWSCGCSLTRLYK